jgi:hypothetical protein
MTTRALLAAVAITAMGMAPVFAQETPRPKNPATPATPATPAQPGKQPDKKTDTPGMPSMDKMQEMMEKMGTPGPNHQLLGGMVGEWTADCKFWMAPGAPPTESKGTASNTWDMGKRFVKQDFNGTFTMDPSAPPMPFHGIGYTGYDNQKQKFVSTWIDTMSTGIMYSEGTYDSSSKTFTFSSDCVDPMTNQPSKMTNVIKIVDDNTHTFTMSGTGPDGKDRKMGEITYRRKGARPTDGGMDKPMRPATPATPATPPSTTPATPKKPNSPG